MLCLVVSHQAVCCVLYVQVRGLVEQTQEWEALYSCTARDNVQVLQFSFCVSYVRTMHTENGILFR